MKIPTLFMHGGRPRGALWRTRLVAVGLLAAAALLSACKDPPPEIEETPPPIKLKPEVAAPAQVDYGEVNLGTYVVKELTLENTGKATLELSNVRLQVEPPGTAGSNHYEIVDLPDAELTAGTSTSMKVKFWAYTKSTDGTTDTIAIDTNDEDEPLVEIALLAAIVKPEIAVQPTVVNFNDVEENQTARKSLTVKNDGDGKLTITDISFDDALKAEFSYTLPANFKLGDSIAPKNAITVDVVYTPKDGTTDAGAMVISSNDNDTQRLSIPISGNSFEDTPPFIEITSPKDGDSFYTGSTVLLTATVTDVGDDPQDLAIFWTSSKEGQLCPGVKADQNGQIFCPAPLSVIGDQTIQVVAVDSASQTGTDKVVFKIWDEETPLSYLISGSDATSLYAFTPDDNIRITVIDGLTGEEILPPCVDAIDDIMLSEPPRYCDAKLGDSIKVQLYDRYGPQASVPRLYLWYGQEDEWNQALVPEPYVIKAGTPEFENSPCEPMLSRAEWEKDHSEPPTDCLVYEKVVEVTIPPPEPTVTSP